jgi:nucleotide-binding universal stress UspA family protein
MERKILVAVDDSLQAMEAVDYVTLMDRSITSACFTLFHVQPALSQYLTEEARHKERARQVLEKTMAENDAKAREILNSAAQRMIRKGIEPERIEKVTMPMNIGVANDILATGKAKYYDAIVVARRGVSSLQKWFMGSVTANLVEHTDLIPVWVVDGTVISEKILLAVDGSSSALRALDHATFMLAGHPTADLEILHVRPRLQDYCDIERTNETARDAEKFLISEDQNCMNDFRGQAMAIIEKNGFPVDHLHWETIDGKLSVARAILNHTARNGYGTVVMGRRGRSKSMFTGSVSRRLLHKAEEAALWLVP